MNLLRLWCWQIKWSDWQKLDKIDIIQALKGYSDTPELDVRFFFEDHPNPTKTQIADFVRRRQSGEPVAKILGHCGFWDLDFLVSTDTLDPRPDSETMIEAVLKNYPNRMEKLRLLDIGTGSGCLLLTLLSQYPDACGLGVDKSVAALQIARQNAIRLNLPAQFKQLDFMNPDWTHDLGFFDIVISNPPYIPTSQISTLSQSVQNFDPLMALDGGKDGLNAYRSLSSSIGMILALKGKVFFEIGQGQETLVQKIMEPNGFQLSEIYPDLGKINRVLMFQRN